MAPRRRGGGDPPATVKKGPWTAEEDAVLRRHVEEHGREKWSSIQSKGPLRRTGKSCRLRYVNILDPELKKGPFSEDEQKTVFEMQREHGNKWSMIAKKLPGRTDNDVKNFWSTHQKRLQRNLPRERPPPPPRRRRRSANQRGGSAPAGPHAWLPQQETAPDIGQSSSQAPQQAANQLRADVAPFPAPGVLRLRAPAGLTAVHAAVERGSSTGAAPFDVKGKGPVSAGTMPPVTRHVGQSSSSSSCRTPYTASQFPGPLSLPGLVELPVHAAAAERGSSSNAAATFGVNNAENSISCAGAGFVDAASPHHDGTAAYVEPLAVVPAPVPVDPFFGQGGYGGDVDPLAMVPAPAPSPVNPFFDQGVNGADVQPLDMQLPDTSFGQGGDVEPLAMVPADPFFGQGVNGWELCVNGADVQPLAMQLPDTSFGQGADVDPLAMVPAPAPADPFFGQGGVNGWELCVNGADVQPLAMQMPDTFGLDDGKYGLLRREARFDHLIMPEDLAFLEPLPSPAQP